MEKIPKNLQFYKFSAYGFLKNLRFFEPFLILFFLEMGINYIQIGILYSIREISTNIFELPTGIIADTFGRRKSMIFSFTSYILSFIIFYFAPGFYSYIIAMIFFSIGEAFRTGTHKAMILSYLEIKKIKHLKIHYYGYTRSASQLGSALSSIIAMCLVFRTGSYKIVFLASIIPYILELFLMFSYPKFLDGEIKPLKGNLVLRVKQRLKLTIRDFINIFKDKFTIKALMNSSVLSGLHKGTKDYLQPILKNYAIALPLFTFLDAKQKSSVLIGLVYFFLYILTSYASRAAGPFSEKIKNISSGINLTFVAGAIFVIISGLFLGFNLYIFSIIFFVLTFLNENLRRPLNIGYISEFISSHIMATGLSGESQLKSIFSALFSFLMGFFAQYIGLSYALIIMGVITIIILPCVKVKEN